MSTRRDHPVLEAIGLVVLFGALVAVAPGAVLTFTVEHFFHAELDTAQRWTWGDSHERRRRLRDGLALPLWLRWARTLHAAGRGDVGRHARGAVRNARALGGRDVE
jgi:hypothetical protein